MSPLALSVDMPACSAYLSCTTTQTRNCSSRTCLPSWVCPRSEQQRLIGDLTNRVMSSLPPEQRKGYLLRPQSFLRIEGMVEAVLEADGITPEMLEAQRAKADLLDRLLRATSDDSRRAIVRENDEQLDYEFFQILTLNIELAQANAQEEAVGQLLELRRQLLEWTTAGRQVAAREDAIRELGSELTREGLLEKLVEASRAGEDTKVETMIAVGRPAIDYVFYQQLTARIEAEDEKGNTREADELKALRERVLDVTAAVDAELQRATEQANQLLQQVLASKDLEEVGELPLGPDRRALLERPCPEPAGCRTGRPRGRSAETSATRRYPHEADPGKPAARAPVHQ